MTKSLVTGALGFVGANLVRALINRGDEVHAWVRSDSEIWRLKDIQDKFTLHKGDVSSLDDCKNIVSGVKPELVFHLAHYGGMAGQSDSQKIREVIIDGTSNLYKACQEVGSVRAIVNAGSSSEYGMQREPMKETTLPQPNTEYGLAKLWATLYGEYLRINKNMPITTLRLFGVYGPYEASFRLFPQVILNFMRGTSPTLSNPATVRDFVYVDDVVDALMLAPDKPKGVFNIGTGVQTSIGDVVEMMSKEIGFKGKLVWNDNVGRSFDSQFWKADMSYTHSIWKWQAKVSVRDGVQKNVEWFLKNKDLYGNI